MKVTVKLLSSATTTTGFNGKSVFEKVPAGDYFLFGNYSWGDETRSSQKAAWNLPITIKAGNNKIVLSNDNVIE